MSMLFLRHGFQSRNLPCRASASYAKASSDLIRNNACPNQRSLNVSLASRYYASEASEPDTSMVVSKETIINSLPEADKARLSRVRNIGISAHIDSGKTTFTERVLFYTGRIKAIHEVRGKDAVGAKMDSMDLEREKGITIQSAATYCDWERVPGDESSDFHFNIIDTPGHIDFTIEVERALRVLDGAVLVVCASSGVQSQTITVDRQMKRYKVPRVTFVNKMDRLGADPWKAIDQLNKKLKIPSAALQVPIGAEDNFEGVIDLIRRKAIYFEGPSGEEVVEKDEIPAHLKGLVEEKRSTLIEMLADVDEEIGEIFLMEEIPTVEQIQKAIRRATIDLKFNPVLIGSALANKGVQPTLDAVCDYLPNPSEIVNTALDQKRDEAPVTMLPYSNKPLISLAFKLEEGRYGQLTYLRVYQGKLKKGMTITNVKTGKKAKLSRLVRMHSSEMEDVDEVGAGEICATFGVDCSSGDTFSDGTVVYTMTSMYVPEPVVSLSINPTSRETANFSKAIARFQREDPTFRVSYDNESKETIISGMGELHLEIYVERIRREYKVECKTGKPHVAYRETVNKTIDFDFTHKKQSGGAGQYARVAGNVGKLESNANEFEAAITQGKIPEKYLIGCERGFEECCEKGPLTGHRVIGVKMIINDGNTHLVDSSEFAFRLATSGAFRQAFLAADPVVLEPIVEVVVTAPVEFQSGVIGLLNKRGATVSSTEIGTDEFTVTCDCSLNDMFGYASSLRASTQGKGEFSMEFKHYAPAPPQLQRQLMTDYEKKLKGDSK